MHALPPQLRGYAIGCRGFCVELTLTAVWISQSRSIFHNDRLYSDCLQRGCSVIHATRVQSLSVWPGVPSVHDTQNYDVHDVYAFFESRGDQLLANFLLLNYLTMI